MSDFAVKSYLGDYPFFGEKPLFPIFIDGVFYTEKDAHIFVANGKGVRLPIPSNDPDNCPAVFVAVNGEEVTPTYAQFDTFEFPQNAWTVPANDEDIIHAIFDWDNANMLEQDWFSDITQFGLNSETGERNQLKSGEYAFHFMREMPSSIESLDVSNLTNMAYMFFNFPVYEGERPMTLNLSSWDTSKVTSMAGLFTGGVANGISNWNVSSLEDAKFMFQRVGESDGFKDNNLVNWDVSNVTNMEGMFFNTDFNQDISGWNTSKVTNMNSMFHYANSFNQDLSEWCVSLIDSEPHNFNFGAEAWTESQPQWGTCPRGENLVKWPITIDGVTYEEEDCHIFVANGNTVQLPIPADDSDNCPAVFVAVDGVEVTPTHVDFYGQKYWTVPANANQTIHAIFDWDNANDAKQDWYSDITQFGLNSETGKQNQLKNGRYAFYSMEASPAAIENLDISNLTYMGDMFNSATALNLDISGWDTSKVERMPLMFYYANFNLDISSWDTSNVWDMQYMFAYSPSFNQDISGWNTSKVTNMDAMFSGASSFNQDLSQWCVSQIDTKPGWFDMGADAWTGGDATRPQWGTCPRKEDMFPDKYSLADAHIFIANGNPINLPKAWYSTVKFLAVDGVEKDYETEVKDKVFNNSTIHAIFDWCNTDLIPQDWYSDILQIGLNSDTGKRNQLQYAICAFYQMAEGTNPAVISKLDVSNIWDMYAMFCQSHSFNQDISWWDVSEVTKMKQMFENTHDFDQDISGWDTRKVTDMREMFFHAHDFNSDISGWNTSKVEQMDSMFYKAYKFNQDLSQWCVSNIAEKPERFDEEATDWTGGDATRPQWGTCPSTSGDEGGPDDGENKELFPIIIDGVTYTEEDAHIFIANGLPPGAPLRFFCKDQPIFVARNGVEVENYENCHAADGDIIHAIFDWDNSGDNELPPLWFHDILQFGSRSVGDEPEGYVNPPALPSGRIPNQLKNGEKAFHLMTDNQNPAAIATLDVSNLTNMYAMFEMSPFFNQDISGWDTSNVTKMLRTFSLAASFDQDISGWDTSNVTTMHGMFSGAASFSQDISQWDTSNVTSMGATFAYAKAFNSDISEWDVSNVTNMADTFGYAESFNQDISGWNTSNVMYMGAMFKNATLFNQDLSQWCVSSVVPYDGYDSFATDSGFEGETNKHPVWGTCPRFEDIELPDGYELEDCHIFIANGNPVQLPVPIKDPDTCPAVFVAVDGVEVTPTYTEVVLNEYNTVYYWSVPANENQIIHGIFDWKDTNWLSKDWFSDILQFGLNSATGERNQLNNGKQAFYEMVANPAIISTLDTSNLTHMGNMFHDSNFNQDISGWNISKVKNMSSMFRNSPFNQDISGWDTSNVTKMDTMFLYASSFNQDLSEWCVSKIDSRPDSFDTGASAWEDFATTRPVWGTCPRFEDIKLPGGYELADCHVFVANGNKVNLPIPDDTNPTFIAVNGRQMNPTLPVTVVNGDIIHAIFDWENSGFDNNTVDLDWFSDILQFGLNSETGKRNQLKSGAWAFWKMTANPAIISNLDTSNLTNMMLMFDGSSFNQDIGGWDTSNVTDMYSMFDSSPFNQDISGWDTSNVTSMRHMFNECSDFNGDISGWDTSNVVEMGWMFCDATSFNQDISGWNVSSATDMNNTFRNASSFNQDISGWNTSSATIMSGMFNNAKAFNQDLSQWCVSNVTQHDGFDYQTTLTWRKPKPVWGTCPRGEDGA